MNADLDLLRHGPLGDHCVHLCVDMQRLFAENTEWKTPWMERVLPRVLALVALQPARTVFTRFIPARRPGEGHGTWRRYYQRWSAMTVDNIGADMVDLVPGLAAFVPPATLVDKHVYSPWSEPRLDAFLIEKHVDTIIVSGGETDVCVLSSVLGAVDRGYRVVIASDALCSSSDETHEALMSVYRHRYGQQIELVTTDLIMQEWR